MYPPVVVVDDQDQVIGTAMLAEVWQKGLYHRTVSIFIVDERNRMLLQLRGPNVKIYPNCWDQAAGGHVDEGFSYEKAAHTEILEELGLADLKLATVATLRTNERLDDGRIINQFERVYRAQISSNEVLVPEQREISQLRWFSSEELREEIALCPEQFTPGLLVVLKDYFSEFYFKR
jgi:isopentenyl-diphosphate Delta-isomerase